VAILQLVVRLMLLRLRVRSRSCLNPRIILAAEVGCGQSMLVEFESRLIPQAADGTVEALLELMLRQVGV